MERANGKGIKNKCNDNNIVQFIENLKVSVRRRSGSEVFDDKYSLESELVESRTIFLIFFFFLLFTVD